MSKKKKLVRPCKLCPFRTNVPVYLRSARARKIATDLRDGAVFWCHETVEYGDDFVGGVATKDSKWCVGAATTMLKEGVLRDNDAARLAIRLGLLDPDTLDRGAPVPDSLAEWTRRHRTLNP